VQTSRDPDATRAALVNIAGLAIAAIQSHDRLHVPAAVCDCIMCMLEQGMAQMSQNYGRAPQTDVGVQVIEVSSPEEFLHVLSRLGLGGRPR